MYRQLCLEATDRVKSTGLDRDGNFFEDLESENIDLQHKDSTRKIVYTNSSKQHCKEMTNKFRLLKNPIFTK